MKACLRSRRTAYRGAFHVREGAGPQPDHSHGPDRSVDGGSADMSNSAPIGAQVAVDEVNQVGGFLGRKLELIGDDQANNDVGLKHAQELVLNEKVAATIGFCNSGVAMKALDVFQTNKHLLIAPCATGAAITAKYPPADSFIFRTSARDQLQTQFLIDEIAKRGLGKVALLVDSSGYGDAGLKDLAAAIARAGLKSTATCASR